MITTSKRTQQFNPSCRMTLVQEEKPPEYGMVPFPPDLGRPDAMGNGLPGRGRRENKRQTSDEMSTDR